MQTLSNLLFASLALTVGTTALADQCAYVKKAQAESFAKSVSVGETLYELCELCGQSTETGTPKALNVTSIGYTPVAGTDYFEVQVNGRGIDLAYTYKKTAELERNNIVLVNAALLVACPTQGVTPSFVTLR